MNELVVSEYDIWGFWVESVNESEKAGNEILGRERK